MRGEGASEWSAGTQSRLATFEKRQAPQNCCLGNLAHSQTKAASSGTSIVEHTLSLRRTTEYLIVHKLFLVLAVLLQIIVGLYNNFLPKLEYGAACPESNYEQKVPLVIFSKFAGRSVRMCWGRGGCKRGDAEQVEWWLQRGKDIV
ncbi:Hypothetical predicted protein [Podarcis lilfordi]|uniref:Uncharacterized protein n=1 Tax=Podarcis lilfordi TaxID=74358 RepID=A0AA35P4N1_9SAUR|nr:Hypothetical predicted protein [Podarcis lilfordi]